MRTLRLKNIFILFPFLGLYAWMVIQVAWVGDDGFITFRSIENFLQGYGPVFNVGERVQTYTHPLWFLLQSIMNFIVSYWKNNPLGSGQLYFVNIFSSIAISIILSFILVLGISRSTQGAILGILILSMSKAFVDYSTSGLENPLTHFILALFIWLFLNDGPNENLKVFGLSVLAALGALNRLDTLLLYLPAIGWVFWKSEKRWRTSIIIGCGFIILLFWEIFSIFYYGSPFPNTAYAKINTEITAIDLIRQGWFYYLNSLKLDPLTLTVIFVSLIGILLKSSTKQKMIAFGSFFYLLYILFIGGDFMSGRYFSPILLTAVALIVSVEYQNFQQYILILVITVAIGVGAFFLIPQRQPNFGRGAESYRIFLDDYRISDERKVWRQQSLSRVFKIGAPKAPFTGETWIYHDIYPVHVELVGPLGLSSHRYGPDVHVIDRNAIADPLISRMPLEDPNQWRIGHFRHIIPDGYLETLSFRKNLINDENIALYYDKLSLIVKGDLWNWKRMIEIWKLNTGKYDYLLENLIVDY